MREVEALLEKAERSSAAADLLLDAGDASSWRKGYCSRKACDTRTMARSWPRAQYGRHFASEGRLDRRYHRFLGRAFELRQLAHYAVEVEVAAVVSELIKVGEEFLEAARDYVGPQES